jgi:hypothetical protein
MSKNKWQKIRAGYLATKEAFADDPLVVELCDAGLALLDAEIATSEATPATSEATTSEATPDALERARHRMDQATLALFNGYEKPLGFLTAPQTLRDWKPDRVH